MKQQTCIPERLDAFLQNELNKVEEQQLTQHLDECADCREELESRAAEQSAWREASSLLGGSILPSTAAIGDLRSSTVRSPQIALVLQQLAPTDDPESLGRIGSYEVTGVVGAGGMGVVLKAHDRSLDRIVAIKVMSPHLASSGSARKRFAREAKAAAAVLHPNVIAIHSVASEDANPYLVMPFVRGASLQKRIDSQGPLPLKDILRIGAQIAAGLAAAHEQGLVHRDIKPANILLEEGVERVTITDFGLARAVDDASMTCSGVIAGTPQYMSPEQARGEPIDARSDLFSLGGVLYAMCTGRSPFRAETTYGVLHRIANDKPTPVCEVNTDVPGWLGQVIERLMAKRPEDRFESAARVAELLEGCLAHVQQPAAIPLPEAVAALAPKKTRRPPIGKFIAAAAIAVALFFAGILIVLELDKGTLTIESEIDDVPIRIMQGENVTKTLKLTKGENSIRIASGTYVVEIDGEFHGIEVLDGQVQLGRRGEVVVKILQNVDEFHGHDTDVHSTSEDHQYLVWEEDGRVRLSHWFAKAVRVDDETLRSINQLLSETWMRYIELESPHTTYSRNSGRLIADVSNFTDERQQLESDFWTRLDEIVSGEQRALLHAISTARGDANGDDTWPWRPKAFPSVIGWHERRFPVRVEIWTKGTWFHYRVSGGEYYVVGDRQTLPAELQHYWTIGNGEFGDKLFDKEMKQIDDRLAKVVEGSTEYSLLTTKKEQLQQQWDLSVAHVKGMAAAAKAESVTLQGEWEFISFESDGVTTEYKTLEVQRRMARLKVAGDRWTVQMGDGTTVLGSGGHRVEIDGNKLTFHGMTTMMPGLGSNEEIPTIGYGLWQVDGDTLTYLMTPAVAESALDGQSEPPIQFPDSFETKGSENNVFRLRRIHPSTPPTSTSSTNSSSSKSSPEFPPVKILVHDEEGKPLEGVKVSLYQLTKDQGGQVLEINETSNASGLAVNRNLPYGHYELSATTSDGWFLSGHGSKLNVEFEKGLSLKLVVPTPAPFGRLTIRDDANLRLAGSAGLRFGILEELVNNGPAFGISPVPEPDGDLGEYSNFPTVTNGIEQVGIEIRFEMMAKNISQPLPSGTHLNSKWKWTPVDKAKSSCRYLIVDGQARAFVNQSVYHDIPFHGLPMEECEMFKLPSAKHRVGGSLFALHEPTAMPLEIEIPAGEMSIYVERIIGKPSLTTMKALNWEPHKDQPELWLEADVQRDSAWFERLIDTSAWIRTTLKPGYNEIAGHLQMHKLIRAGETLEVSLSPKPVDQKTSSASAARTLDDITSVYNDQTRQLRTELFTPPIPDLATAQMRAAMLDAAGLYREHGKVEIASALKTSAETNQLVDRLTFMGMSGTMSDGFRQITPGFQFEVASNARFSVILSKAELRYSRNGWSSKAWGDIHPPITGKWNLVSVEERGESLTEDAFNDWRTKHASWTDLSIDDKSLTMDGGKSAMRFDFEIDYNAGVSPQYTISQDGEAKFAGIFYVGINSVDDTTLTFAVDLEGRSKPRTFPTSDGKTTNLTYRRVGETEIQANAP